MRRWVIGLGPATLIGVALLSMVGNPHPTAAQQGERLAVVSGYFDAQNRADVDESLIGALPAARRPRAVCAGRV